MTFNGVDLLGLAKCDVQMVMANLPRNVAVGTLWGTFGNVEPLIDIFSKSKKVSVWRVHLGNGSCIRMANCQPNEMQYNDFKELEKRVGKLEALALKYPKIRFYASPFVEYGDPDKKIVDRWFDIIKSAPKLLAVGSTVGKLRYVPHNIRIERHGNSAHGDLISNDGESLFDAPHNWAVGGREVSLGWIHSMNGRKPKETAWVPPLLRPSKNFITKEELLKCLKLLGF